MPTPNNELKNLLRRKYGLSPAEPTSQQIQNIKRYLQVQGRIISGQELEQTIAKYCPSFGSHTYAGVDNTDLTTLLKLISKEK
ncbi:hypothetical protein GCM10011332_33190 [Terasakiella brassicae]|uniref:Uncharacterized protein n=1 Tax=Terasakiella brassicae TaxID=1634917 RepID=A0A917FGW8_9PROT|nr:hypothetical protein [Terasakiella brassicae]GGF76548.1 hypothetical protein GCM10011332_33190 [Terasakiella brassicae]